MDHDILQTADQVLEALGGSQGVAEITGSKLNAVGNWKIIKSFPANTYVVMTAALAARGKRAPASLWRMKLKAPTHETEAAE